MDVGVGITNSGQSGTTYQKQSQMFKAAISKVGPKTTRKSESRLKDLGCQECWEERACKESGLSGKSD